MKLIQSPYLLAFCLVRLIGATPTEPTAKDGNPLASLPHLNYSPEDDPAFFNLDRDGVYRAYRMDGTVADAARLTDDQIETWLEARAGTGYQSEAQIAAERAVFEGVDSSAVSDAELLHPGESVKPAKDLAAIAAKADVSRRNPLEKRQDDFGCDVHIFCNSRPQVCRQVYPPGRCRCNGVICV